jgi:tetratricopeptide (TPR) repeat protein
MKANEPQACGTARIRRRRLLLWSVLPGLLLLCVALKLLSVGPLAGQAASAFAANDAHAAGMAAEALQLANILERHKAPFAAGDALVLAGDIGAARLRFEEALNLAPADSADACIIRLNLVLAIERLGDDKLRSEDPASAAALFTEALDIAGAAPGGCFAGTEAAESGQKLSEAEGRLKGKLEGAAEGQAGTPKESGEVQPEAGTPSRSQLEELAESGRESQRERNSGREREDYLSDTDYAPGPDRPW